MDRMIRQYKKQYPDLVDDQVSATKLYGKAAETQIPVTDTDLRRITGTVNYVGRGTNSCYAYVTGNDGKEYSITESIYSRTDRATEVLQKGNKISFIPEEGKKKMFATQVELDI